MRRYQLFFVLLICGCSSKPVVLNSDYSPQTRGEAVNSECQYVVVSVDDTRNDRDSLGRLGLSDVSSEDIIEWINKAFIHRGYHVGNEAITERTRHALDVSLKLAYIRSSSTSKATNIVLGVHDNEADEVVYYRGTDAGINWYGTAEEIKSSFDAALSKAIDKIDKDLEKDCMKGPERSQ